MACGDRYRAAVRTSDGRTLDDLCGTFCAAEDYTRWRTVADRWWGLVEGRWAEMVAAAGESGALPDGLLRDLLTYQQAYRDLPGSLFTALVETGTVRTNLGWVEAVAQNVADATCLLERMDSVLVGMGRDPRPIATMPGARARTGTGSAWPWLIGVGAAAGAYGAWRLMRGGTT